MRIVARDSKAEPDLQQARQIIRLDALKALIGILLEQMDELTNPNIPHGEMDSLLQSMVRHFETELIRRALIRTGGRQRAAARLLGEKKTTLNAKILRYGIEIDVSS
jgi:DNA-binding NtrC family response regulator